MLCYVRLRIVSLVGVLRLCVPFTFCYYAIQEWMEWRWRWRYCTWQVHTTHTTCPCPASECLPHTWVHRHRPPISKPNTKEGGEKEGRKDILINLYISFCILYKWKINLFDEILRDILCLLYGCFDFAENAPPVYLAERPHPSCTHHKTHKTKRRIKKTKKNLQWFDNIGCWDVKAIIATENLWRETDEETK